MDHHISQEHNCNWRANTLVKSFPFELLPPGSWTVQQVVHHYRRISQTAEVLKNKRIDFSRIEAIENLSPTACYVGKESWLGYVVFEFADANGVVLECPVKNNATYVIAGDWKSMISLTKSEIRYEYKRFHERVIHGQKWFEHVRRAIRRTRHVIA